ncbi:MAG: hypothetical protein ACFFG0_49865, partial [Candidatus Thorarchaeota archaeon]
MNGKVNSESDSNENPMKKFTFILTGVPPDQAIKEITLDLSKSQSELLSEIKINYGLRTDTQLKFLVDGKMRVIAQIVQMPILSKPITMMKVQEGAGSFTVEQYNLLTDIYYILNPNYLGQEIGIHQINDLLVEFDIDKRLVRNLFNFPKDINPILELQSQFQNKINDETMLSEIQNRFNEFIIDNELIGSQYLDSILQLHDDTKALFHPDAREKIFYQNGITDSQRSYFSQKLSKVYQIQQSEIENTFDKSLYEIVYNTLLNSLPTDMEFTLEEWKQEVDDKAKQEGLFTEEFRSIVDLCLKEVTLLNLIE